MSYDYSMLRGRIVEKYGNVRKFAAVMDLSETSMYKKIHNEVDWKQSEIERACQCLYIPKHEISSYFFTLQVQKN